MSPWAASILASLPIAWTKQRESLEVALRRRVNTQMRIPLFQVDDFTSQPLAGNPAALCPLDRWLDDGLLRKVAAENNLSETAFLVPRDAHARCEVLAGESTQQVFLH